MSRGKDAFETFPTFSPDGNTLYFCSSVAQDMPNDYQKVKYDLCRYIPIISLNWLKALSKQTFVNWWK